MRQEQVLLSAQSWIEIYFCQGELLYADAPAIPWGIFAAPISGV
jgi:hypothetical protein